MFWIKEWKASSPVKVVRHEKLRQQTGAMLMLKPKEGNINQKDRTPGQGEEGPTPTEGQIQLYSLLAFGTIS